MSKVIDYKTVRVDAVTASLKEGWQPWGSAAKGYEGFLMQPVVKYEEYDPAEDATLADAFEEYDRKRAEQATHVDLDDGTRVHLLADGPTTPRTRGGRDG